MQMKTHKIIDTACELWDVKRDDVLGLSRKSPLPFARIMIAKFLRERTAMTTTGIGRVLNRDHATVQHYLNVYDGEYRYDPHFRAIADKLEQRLINESGFIGRIRPKLNNLMFGVCGTDETSTETKK